MTDTLPKADRVEQADGAKDAAATSLEQTGGTRVMSLDEMIALVDDGKQDELDAYLAERGVEVDWGAIDHRMALALGEDGLMLERGQALSTGRIDRVHASIEKAVVQVAREEANSLMAKEEQEAMFASDPRPDDEKFGRWCCICSGSCEDCISFHGVVQPMDYWDGISPSDGSNKCGKRCRCRVLPCAGPARQS